MPSQPLDVDLLATLAETPITPLRSLGSLQEAARASEVRLAREALNSPSYVNHTEYQGITVGTLTVPHNPELQTTGAITVTPTDVNPARYTDEGIGIPAPLVQGTPRPTPWRPRVEVPSEVQTIRDINRELIYLSNSVHTLLKIMTEIQEDVKQIKANHRPTKFDTAGVKSPY